jgi:hypothetical protein
MIKTLLQGLGFLREMHPALREAGAGPFKLDKFPKGLLGVSTASMELSRSARMRHAFMIAVTMLAAAPLATPVHAGNKIPGTSCNAFPDDSWWHADISKLAVHPRSADWLSHMSMGVKLHPDFGPSFGAITVPYGIPITVVGGSHPRVTVSFQYASQSDKVRYPLGADSAVEGGQWKTGDRHVIIVRKDNCQLYETWATTKKDGKWFAGSGATWDLNSNALRPRGWTSADAAGLPILPGLLRLEEVKAGNIDHAIRFTTNVSDRKYLWPARHQAGGISDSAYPPMGARFRLKASYKVASSLRADTKAVLKAMKTYGMVLADNGSPWYFQGTAEDGWPNALLDELKQVPASAFEAVDTSPLRISPDSMQVKAQ